jgi:hypothetical protein
VCKIKKGFTLPVSIQINNAYEERFQHACGALRGVADSVVNRYLDCGNPMSGCLHVRALDDPPGELHRIQNHADDDESRHRPRSKRPTSARLSMTGKIEVLISKPVQLPPLSPNLNAHVERFHRSLEEDCLNRMIFFGEMTDTRVFFLQVVRTEHMSASHVT